MQVQIDWFLIKIIAYGEQLWVSPTDTNPIYEGAPEDYTPDNYNWNPSVPNVFDADDFSLKVNITLENIQARKDKLDNANYYMANSLTVNQFQTLWLVDVRNQQTDYLRGGASLITWINSATFSGKGYYSVQRKTDLLNILN